MNNPSSKKRKKKNPRRRGPGAYEGRLVRPGIWSQPWTGYVRSPQRREVRLRLL